MKRQFLFLFCLLTTGLLFAQTSNNLLPIEEWEEGQGNYNGWIKYGTDAANNRQQMIGPDGSPVIGWRALSVVGEGNTNGGFRHNFTPDISRSYRFSMWMRRNDSDGGYTAFRSYGGQSQRLDGSGNGDQFWAADLPTIGDWYLIVAYIHREDYVGTTSYGGIYDKEGNKVVNITDYKWLPTATVSRLYTYFRSAPDNESQDFYSPRVEVVSGNEPSIEALLGLDNLGGKQTGNLLPVENWNIGSGTIHPFSRNSTDLENTRDYGIDPHGESSIIWSANAGNGSSDGGWNAYFPVDHIKSYRFSVWVRKRGSADGSTYLGAANGAGVTLNLNGTTNTNPYFWSGDLPELDKWYLIVGYVHGSGYTGTTSIGGIYDGETGEKVLNATDFKNSTTVTQQRHRAYLFYCNNCLVNGVGQDFWGPRAEAVDGNEPTIEALLGIDNGPHVWSEITDGAVYNEGSVGIGVDENDMDTAYKLLVDGDIKTRKVRVSLDGWADHVFDDDYQLPSLAEVEKYIVEHKHLPGMPSEEVVLKEGLYLGEANTLLLQKIEELTLYSIEMKKEMEAVKKEMEAMKKGMEALQEENQRLKNK